MHAFEPTATAIGRGVGITHCAGAKASMYRQEASGSNSATKILARQTKWENFNERDVPRIIYMLSVAMCGSLEYGKVG